MSFIERDTEKTWFLWDKTFLNGYPNQIGDVYVRL